MILKLRGDINGEMTDKLIQSLNLKSEDELLHIYLNSKGGGVDEMNAMIDVINENRESIVLHGYGDLCSCAFELFFSVECERHLLKGTRGMFHQSEMVLDINEDGKPSGAEDKFRHKYMKSMKTITMDYCDILNFTKKEKKQIKKNKDVWFMPDRMQEFLEMLN